MSRSLQKLACNLALLAGLSAAAERPTAQLSFTSSMTKAFLDDRPTDALTWTVKMARAEREGFQLLVSAPGERLESVIVRNVMPKWRGVTATLSLVAYVRTEFGDRRPWAGQEPPTRIGWWPDPLIPMRTFDVATGETQPVWLRLESSAAARPGEFRGRLELERRGKVIARIGYRVRVYPFVLPKSQQLKNAAFMPAGHLYTHYRPAGGIGGQQFVDLYKKWAAEAFAQHLGPTFDMLMGWNEGKVRDPAKVGPLTPTKEMLQHGESHVVWPVVIENGRYDFRLINELAAIGREYGLSQFAVAIFDREITWQQQTEASKRDFRQFIEAYRDYLRPRGLWESAYVYNVDEPPESQWDTVRNIHAFVKSVAPELKTWLCLNEPKAVRLLSPSADILDVYIRQYERSGVEELRRGGKPVIWALCIWPHEHPNLFIEYPAIDARIVGWLTYRYGVSGFEYWGLNQWGPNTGNRAWVNFRSGDARTSWKRTEWPWGDGWLMYPGENGEPLSSIRFENLRDGFEDCEMLKILARRDGPHEAGQLAARVAASIQSYDTRPEALNAAHAELIERLSRKSNRAAASEPN